VQSSNSTAQVLVRAATAGQDAQLVLTQGSSAFSLLHRGSSGSFVVNDGTNDVFTMAKGSGDTALRGSLTVGGGTGARALTVKANSGNAALEVSAATSGTASLSATAASGQTAKLALASGTKSMEIAHDGSSDKLKITDGTSELISISRTTGTFYSKGGLTIGGGSSAAAATIKSTGGASSISVISAASNATATITAAAGNDAGVHLAQGANVFKMTHSAAANKFALTDGTNDLLTIARSDGAVVTRGDITIGGTGNSGPKALSVSSSDSAASVAIKSGGSSAASMSVTSPNGQDASVTLTETAGRSWYMKSDASSNHFAIGEGSNDWLKIEQTGASVFKGDLSSEANLVVGGGTTSGAKSITVDSPDNVATLAVQGFASSVSVTANGNGLYDNAMLQLNAQAGKKSALTLKTGDTQFHMINDGASNTFQLKGKVSGGAQQDLLTIAASTGDTTILGGLNVKSGRLIVDSATGYVGVGAKPSVQLHVNGSMKVENGDFTVGYGKLFVKHENGYIGVNNFAPHEAIHIKGNVKIEPDGNGNGGHLFATKGAVHFKYNNAAQGSVDREYYMASKAGVTLPTDTNPQCTSNCVPTSSRIYMIRNKSNSGQITISCSVSVPVRKNGSPGDINSGAAMTLAANGMALCAFDVTNTRYDCWTWNE
jgi:hypothetical protein